MKSKHIEFNNHGDEDMKEIDPEGILLEAKLRKYCKKVERNERANLSSNYEPIKVQRPRTMKKKPSSITISVVEKLFVF